MTYTCIVWMLDFFIWRAELSARPPDRAGHPQLLWGGRMTDYYRYKECMDDARKMTLDAEELMAKPGAARNSESHLKCASLLKKGTLLRELAMEFAFGGPRPAQDEGGNAGPSRQEPVGATPDNGAIRYKQAR
jgi:hypothetical protein